MEHFTLGRLARATDADLEGRAALVATGVSTDSRAIKAGEVFFALQGDRFDGTRFVRQAFRRGARAAVVPRGGSPHFDATDGPLVWVDDVRLALGAFARSYREELGFQVVAVTGSAGKTTTKDLLHTMLSGQRRVVKAPKSFNNDVGVPLTLLSANRRTQVVVLEVGCNAPGEIDALGAIAQPDLAIVTCIGQAHLEGLGGLDGVAREKLSLLAHLRPGGTAVLNGDDLRLRGAASALASTRGPEGVVLCGLEPNPDLAWQARVFARSAGWRAVTYREALPGPTLDLPLPGRAFAVDALLAMAAATRLGLHPQDAANRLASFGPAAGRWNVVNARGVTLVDDTYNANPTSVAASLETFATQAVPARRVVVLGGMNELGAAAEPLHRGVGQLIARHDARMLVCVGSDARWIAEGARRAGFDHTRIVCVADAEQVAPALRARLGAGDAVLFKGSRGYGLEVAVRETHTALAAALARAA